MNISRCPSTEWISLYLNLLVFLFNLFNRYQISAKRYLKSDPIEQNLIWKQNLNNMYFCLLMFLSAPPLILNTLWYRINATEASPPYIRPNRHNWFYWDAEIMFSVSMFIVIGYLSQIFIRAWLNQSSSCGPWFVFAWNHSGVCVCHLYLLYWAWVSINGLTVSAGLLLINDLRVEGGQGLPSSVLEG